MTKKNPANKSAPVFHQPMLEYDAQAEPDMTDEELMELLKAFKKNWKTLPIEERLQKAGILPDSPDYELYKILHTPRETWTDKDKEILYKRGFGGFVAERSGPSLAQLEIQKALAKENVPRAEFTAFTVGWNVLVYDTTPQKLVANIVSCFNEHGGPATAREFGFGDESFGWLPQDGDKTLKIFVHFLGEQVVNPSWVPEHFQDKVIRVARNRPRRLRKVPDQIPLRYPDKLPSKRLTSRLRKAAEVIE